MRSEGMRALAYPVKGDDDRDWTVIYLIGQGRISQVLTEQNDAPGVGDIYLGRVVQISKAISASFVETEGGRFFLPGIHKMGAMLPVMVETLAYREKLAKATTKLSVNGMYMVVRTDVPGICCSQKLTAEQKDRLQRMCEKTEIRELLKDGAAGILFRTKAGEADEEELTAEVKRLTHLLGEIRQKADSEANGTRLYAAESVIAESIRKVTESGGVWITESQELYEKALAEAEKMAADPAVIRLYRDERISMAALYGLRGKVKQICSERIWLDCGAEIVITEAEAMCVIDVNSAKVRPGKGREETFLQLNLEAAREIVSQIVARNISGTILIDFISMESTESETILLSEMRSLSKGTYPPIKAVDITKLGIMETTRQRLKGSIRERKDLLDKTILL